MSKSDAKKKWLIFLILFVLLATVTYMVWNKIRHRHKQFSYEIKLHQPFVKGYMLLGVYEKKFQDAGQIVIMDMDGKVYFKRNTGAIVYDFRQWNIGGRIYYTYFVDDSRAYHIKDILLTSGHAVILDSAMHEIKEVHLHPHNGITIDKKQDLDLHDIIMFSDNHYIVASVYEKNVSTIPDSLHPSPRVLVATTVIQEIKNDSVIWQWDASAFPELYGLSNFSNYSDTTKTQDYMHPNSLSLDPHDSNLLISFRHMDMVLKVNRHSGAIMWRLGGRSSDFELTEEQKFYGQHHVTVEGENILLFDNGEVEQRHYSRINEYKLDEANKKVNFFKSYTINDTFCRFMGSVEKRNDHYFIGCGTGQCVLDINCLTGEKDYLMQNNMLSYRVYIVDSIYGLEKEVAKR